MEGELYRECLRNHAASLGSYATDGCGEFTLDATDPGGLLCAACGCHRNFHRKLISSTAAAAAAAAPSSTAAVESPESERSGGHKKRIRTKFTADQKEKMLAFAEKIRWKLQRKEEEDEIERFCRGVGVSRQVFKVWMHNHKNSSSSSSSASTTLTQ